MSGFTTVDKTTSYEKLPNLAKICLKAKEGVFVGFVDIYRDGEKMVEGTDYTAKSGSTRITIKNSTLALVYTGNSDDAHTLGIEFQTEFM